MGQASNDQVGRKGQESSDQQCLNRVERTKDQDLVNDVNRDGHQEEAADVLPALLCKVPPVLRLGGQRPAIGLSLIHI